MKHLRGAATYRSARRWDGPAVQAGRNLVQAARSAVKRRLNGTDGAPSRLPGQLHASLFAAASPALKPINLEALFSGANPFEEVDGIQEPGF